MRRLAPPASTIGALAISEYAARSDRHSAALTSRDGSVAGNPARASRGFERTLPFVSGVGLLVEKVDSATGELLGSYPQAFSHIGRVNAAWAISEAWRSAPDAGGATKTGRM